MLAMKKNGIFLIGFIWLFQTGFNQVNDLHKYKYWIDVGSGGYYSIDNIEGFSWSLGVNLIADSTLYRLRFLNQREFKIPAPDPLEESYSVGMMIGKALTGKYIQIEFSGGLGITGGIKRGRLLYTSPPSGWIWVGDPGHYEKDEFMSPSIPLEIDLLIKPIKYLGVGFSLFADLNLKSSTYGLMFKLGLGKLR